MPKTEHKLSRFELWSQRKHQSAQKQDKNLISSDPQNHSDLLAKNATQASTPVQTPCDNKTYSQINLSSNVENSPNIPSSTALIQSLDSSESALCVEHEVLFSNETSDKNLQSNLETLENKAIPSFKDLDLSAIFHSGEFDEIDPLDSYNLDYKSVPSLSAVAAQGLKHWQRIHQVFEDKEGSHDSLQQSPHQQSALQQESSLQESVHPDVLTVNEPLSASHEDHHPIGSSPISSSHRATTHMLNQFMQSDTRPFAKARMIAIQNTPEIEFLNPVTVNYQSQGQLLICLDANDLPDLSPNEWDQLTQTSQSLMGTTILVLSSSSISEAQKSQLDAWQNLGAIYYAASVELSGHLGAFMAIIETVSSSQTIQVMNLATLAINQQGFDIALDFSKEPLIPATIAAIGYYPVGRGYPKMSQAFDEIPGLIGEFDKPKFFQLDADLCAHSQRGLSGCERCIDACPAGALSSEPTQNSGQVIQINPYLCQGVGTCASACPSEAIRYAYPNPEQTQDFAKQLISHYLKAGGQNPVLLFCSAQHQKYNTMLLSHLPANVLPIELEELPSVGIDTWFSALASGACQVMFAASLHMPEQVRNVLESQVSYAQSLLTQLQLEPARISICYMETFREKAPDLILSPLSELFALNYQNELDKQALSQYETGSSAPQGSYQVSDDVTNKQHNQMLHKKRGGKQEFDFKEPQKAKQRVKPDSPKRQRLFQSLDTLAQAYPPEEVIYHMPVEAALGTLDCSSARCTLCMGCVSVCPTGALQASPDSPSLQIIEQKCVQCGLCAQGCPEKALALKPQMNWQTAQRQTPQVLHQEEPAHCLRCDKAFAPMSMIQMLQQKLALNPHFSDQKSLDRIAMCDDCRVKDRMQEMIQNPQQQGLI